MQEKKNVSHSRTHIGGIYASLDIAPACKRTKSGNEILNVVEMPDGETNLVKRCAAKDLKDSKIKVGIMAHDCACVIKREFEGVYCEKALLDCFHNKHKCGLAQVTHTPMKNYQAAEQLWSRLDDSLASSLSLIGRGISISC